MSIHLESVIERLIDIPIKRARLGYGSFLTIDLGEPIQGEKNRWEWHVWIYCCYWKLYRNDLLITHCEDDGSRITSEIEAIEGRCLTQLVVGVDGCSEFRFSGGSVLKTTPWEEESESWMIYTPEGVVLTLNHDGTLSVGD